MTTNQLEWFILYAELAGFALASLFIVIDLFLFFKVFPKIDPQNPLQHTLQGDYLLGKRIRSSTFYIIAGFPTLYFLLSKTNNMLKASMRQRLLYRLNCYLFIFVIMIFIVAEFIEKYFGLFAQNTKYLFLVGS